MQKRNQNKPILIHVMMESPFQIGMGYQENFLASKHVELGYDVHVISTSEGINWSPEERIQGIHEIITENELHIHYLPINTSWLRRIPFVVGWTRIAIGLRDTLEAIKPNIIFLHGICRIDNKDVIDYCITHPEVRLYADNHSDYYNTPVETLRSKSFRMGVGRYIGKKLNQYAQRVWGVTPWRVTYQEKVYGIDQKKSGLLVMGGDEKQIHFEKRFTIRQQIRQQLGIPDNAFTIISGGKINREKNIHLLIEAVKAQEEDIHLIIFGKFESDMEEYAQSISNSRIHYVGWIHPNKANDYFLSSDVACFPGTHSVLWEQACACGIPTVYKDWNGGFSHLDVGGNCLMLTEISISSLKEVIQRLHKDKALYSKMQKVAENTGRETFSYINIAKRSIEQDNK